MTCEGAGRAEFPAARHPRRATGSAPSGGPRITPRDPGEQRESSRGGGSERKTKEPRGARCADFLLLPGRGPLPRPRGPLPAPLSGAHVGRPRPCRVRTNKVHSARREHRRGNADRPRGPSFNEVINCSKRPESSLRFRYLHLWGVFLFKKCFMLFPDSTELIGPGRATFWNVFPAFPHAQRRRPRNAARGPRGTCRGPGRGPGSGPAPLSERLCFDVLVRVDCRAIGTWDGRTRGRSRRSGVAVAVPPPAL